MYIQIKVHVATYNMYIHRFFKSMFPATEILKSHSNSKITILPKYIHNVPSLCHLCFMCIYMYIHVYAYVYVYVNMCIDIHI